MHSIETTLPSRHAVGSESEANATQSNLTDKKPTERRKGEGREEKHNGFRRKLALHQGKKEQTEESGRQEKHERDQRSRMHLVAENLLRSRHSVGSEAGRESASTREREREREVLMNTVGCLQSKKACYEAVIQSEGNRKGEGTAMPNTFSRSLLRSRHSVGKRNKREIDREYERERDRETEREQ
jgi:hypothetical protein